jgi:superfamily II DNA or RNA helicase
VDYSSENGFDVDSNVHQISAGKDKNTKKSVVISTWQSLQGDKVSNGWLNSFDGILVDEMQTAKGQEIQKLMERCTDVSYRIGLTGTLDNIKINRLVINGLFGNIHRVSTTRKLMDEGHLSDLKIRCLILDYSKDTKKLFRGKIDYALEMKFISEHERRNKFIRNLALSLTGNTLILFNFVTHGKTIHESLVEKAGDRQIHMIYGGVEADDREEIRQLMINSKNVIAVASYGTTAAGVNIPNVENIIFASPYKSMIRVLQSIGRGLRNAEGKEHCKLFDISDRLSGSKSKPNHTYNHLIERLRIYSTEGFNYKLTEISIEE